MAPPGRARDDRSNRSSGSRASARASVRCRRLPMLSLDIARGDFFCLVGASGSGKTTLLRPLAGFETPERGRILIGGRT